MTRVKQLIAAAVVVILLKKRNEKKKRRFWVRKWIAQREKKGAYAKLLSELREENEEFFKNFVRLSYEDFNFVLEKIDSQIKKKDTHMRKAISSGERLALTLRYLATGDNYASLMYLFRIPVTTIAKIIPEVCKAIFETLKAEFLQIPNSPEEWLRHAELFEEKWNFPNCIGALDGKHILMKAPSNSGSTYFNYKGSHSIVLMALVDANYCFLYTDIGCNGRVADGGVFLNCSLSRMMERNLVNIPDSRPLPQRKLPVPFVIVADDAFSMTTYLMKPYPFRNQPGPNRIFNYRLSRARRIVENVFGLIAAKFRVLRKPMEICPSRASNVVSAICVLHNLLLKSKNSSRLYAPHGTFDTEKDGEVIAGSWRKEGMSTRNLHPVEAMIHKNSAKTAKDIRIEFTQYFMSKRGEIQWQYKFI